MKSTPDNVLTESEQTLIQKALINLCDLKREALEIARAADITIDGKELTESDFGISAIQMLLAKFNHV
uniref:hypothetical protein n=1 Tax=Acidovorax sp. SUPP3334 TaxID=2920881 RepID=UPI00295294DC|nr:hypothetical protein [Acidovorax sp. SUPP3334]BDH38333.1 hypothetical protein AVHM3334_23040 [Acidovorax sp. SUPP3334]